MTNGNVSIPGVFVAGGVGVSNTALLIGGAALATWLWFAYSDSQKKQFGDSRNIQTVMDDVYAYAAYPTQVTANRDRVRAAIQRARSAFQTARDSYKKKIKDLVAAKKAGTITHAQFREQLRLANQEFHAAIRTRHQEIMDELGISVGDSHTANVVPTVP